MEALLIFAMQLGLLLGANVSPKEAVMFQIMCVESSGKVEGWHKDGTSWGLFGMSEGTAKWLGKELGKTPKEQYETAEAYLDKMLEESGGDLLEAAGKYHSKKPERKEAYKKQLENVNPTGYKEAIEKFKSIITEE